jgi:phosphatidylglycerol lysyltransferase
MRPSVRRSLFGLLVILLLWVLISHLADLTRLLDTLLNGRWQLIAAAAVLQLVYYVMYSGLYQAAFDTVGVESNLRQLLPVVMASIAANVAAPSGGASGAAIFVDDAARRHQSPARAAVGAVLCITADLGSFVLVLAAGLAFMAGMHDLKSYELIGAAVFLALFAGLACLLLLGMLSRRPLLRLLHGLQRLLARLATLARRAPPLSADWPQRTAAELTAAAQAIRAHPAKTARTLAVALASHLINLSSLYAVCLAFEVPLRLSPLVAAYAMGIVFWVVSITPQGIGVVEGVMTLVLVSLGIPGDRAAAIAISYRGLTFWLPLLLGFLALRRLPLTASPSRASGDIWSVRAAALLTAGMGLVNVMAALTPGLAVRLRLTTRLPGLIVHHGGHLTAALTGFALMVLAASLWRRKRIAWILSLVALAFTAAAHWLRGHDFRTSIIALALLIWLLTQRPHFHARSDSPSVWQGLRLGAFGLAFTLVYGTAGFYLLDEHFKVPFSLAAALSQTLTMFTSFYNPGLEPITGFGRYFAASIYIIGLSTLGSALLLVIRPVLIRQPASETERKRAHQIVERFGHSSLARVALFDDKSYCFTGGGSVIAFAVHGRGAVALGDPIGPEAQVPHAIQAFIRLCQPNDWIPAFYQVQPVWLEAYRSAGLSLLRIGEEAVVRLASFSLEGGANKPIRWAYNHLLKLGHTSELWEPPLTRAQLDDLRRVSDEWLAYMHGTEKRFSVGWFDDDYLRDCRVMVARTDEGWISAFANLLPEYASNVVAIDLMRHRAQADRSTMDFLFVSLILWAREHGYDGFDLGLSALSGVGQRSGDPAVERALHFIFEHITRFYNFKGLHTFKNKFQPEWSPRYLAYPGPASLPIVVNTLLRADSGASPLLPAISLAHPLRLPRSRAAG